MLAEIVKLFGSARPLLWLELIRPHHWSKNLLLFVPALTSFLIFDSYSVVMTLVAFLAFCCAASSGYVLNDLVDKHADQTHPLKSARPLASEAVTVEMAVIVFASLLAAALSIAYTVGSKFFVLVIAYLFLTTAYSLALKRLFLADVVILATLYVMRVVAGAVAIDIPVSYWLIAFAMPLFVSLAVIKRCAEVVYIQQIGQATLPGRAYCSRHLPLLWIIGICSAVIAVVIFGLFISYAKTVEQYASSNLLFLVAALLTAWLSSLWFAAYRGRVGPDPVVYVLKKRETLCYAALMLGLTLVAQLIAI